MENIIEADATNKEKAEILPSSSLDTVKDLVEVIGKIGRTKNLPFLKRKSAFCRVLIKKSCLPSG
jgi:hypothetical protein